MKHYRPKNFL